jgi:hypothetical protein
LSEIRRERETLERGAAEDPRIASVPNDQESKVLEAPGASTPGLPQPTYQSLPRSSDMSLDEFRLDYKKLKGRNVELSGTVMMQGDMLVLMPSLLEGVVNTDMIFLEWEHLTRETRKQVLENCRGSGCTVTVTGTVKDVMFNKGLRVRSLAIN